MIFVDLYSIFLLSHSPSPLPSPAPSPSPFHFHSHFHSHSNPDTNYYQCHDELQANKSLPLGDFIEGGSCRSQDTAEEKSIGGGAGAATKEGGLKVRGKCTTKNITLKEKTGTMEAVKEPQSNCFRSFKSFILIFNSFFIVIFSLIIYELLFATSTCRQKFAQCCRPH